MVGAFEGEDMAASTESRGAGFLRLLGRIEGTDAERNLVLRVATPDGKDLGELRLPVLPQRPGQADLRALAAASARAVAGLLRGEGSGVADLASRPQVRLRPVKVPPNVDGQSLTEAMARALARQGLAIDGPAPTFEVEGSLRIAPGANGQDLVQVDWTVRDGTGKELGSVSQGSPVARETLLGQMALLSRQIADGGAEGVAEVIRKSLPAP